MLTFKGRLKDHIIKLGGKVVLMLDTDLSAEYLEEIKDKELKVQVSVWRQDRSLNANNYCWKLLDEIAQRMHSTKEEVYQEIISKVGVFEILPIRNEAVDNFVEKWQSRGLGWVCNIMRDSKIPNYTNVIAYYGSSVYNTKEMSRLIDEVVQEAQALGVQVKTPQELAELKNLWGQYEKQNK